MRVIDSINYIESEVKRLAKKNIELEKQNEKFEQNKLDGIEMKPTQPKIFIKLETVIEKLKIQRIAKTIFLNYVKSIKNY